MTDKTITFTPEQLKFVKELLAELSMGVKNGADKLRLMADIVEKFEVK